MSNRPCVSVIGAGLAGCEAADRLARWGIAVDLFEMKPQKRSPAHKGDGFAELVCSNSLRSDQLTNAVGLLKQEMRQLGSLILRCADRTRVPAGGALAVDREGFTALVTEQIRSNPLITVHSEECTEIPAAPAIIATGPLTSDALSERIGALVGGGLHFYDAAAPVVTYESLDHSKVFRASRYDRGADYLNCPLTREEYFAFYRALVSAETAPLHAFETPRVVEGCMPVEVMGRRGEDTLRFGPMKPVGIKNPATGEEYYAVVQLRRENDEGTMYNIVGFQTHLTFPEQRRVFRMIPGLENAEFVRYGVMHRNTFLRSPGLLTSTYEAKKRKGLFFAGQMTGVEGYVESVASGFVAGINADPERDEPFVFPSETALGALANYISTADPKNFQPMNVNFGIFPPLEFTGKKVKKADRKELYSLRSLEIIKKIGEKLL